MCCFCVRLFAYYFTLTQGFTAVNKLLLAKSALHVVGESQGKEFMPTLTLVPLVLIFLPKIAALWDINLDQD